MRRFWVATTDDVENPDTWLAGMMRAPVVIVPCSSRAAYEQRYREPDKGAVDLAMPFWHMDVAMAALLILQTAVDEGPGRLLLRGAAGP